jgi:hypothetical protein
MSTVFGEVAALYDEVRPEHPAALADTILAYAGRGTVSVRPARELARRTVPKDASGVTPARLPRHSVEDDQV